MILSLCILHIDWLHGKFMEGTTMKWTVKELWTKACEYDGFPADTKFAVFSPKNPWAKKYSFAAYCLARYREQN